MGTVVAKIAENEVLSSAAPLLLVQLFFILIMTYVALSGKFSQSFPSRRCRTASRSARRARGARYTVGQDQESLQVCLRPSPVSTSRVEAAFIDESISVDLFRNDADWFLKADDDTFVVVENLRYLLESYRGTDPIFFGCKFKPYVAQGYMSGGAGNKACIVMSHTCVRALLGDFVMQAMF